MRHMTKAKTGAPPSEADQLAGDLKARLGSLIDSIVSAREANARDEWDHLLQKGKELVRRKLAMQGTKNETRDLLGELLFGRLRRGFREFLKSADARLEVKAAEWVLGNWLAGGALTEFAQALDKAILEAGAPREYSFAGRTDFISVEEVMQLLGAGKHTGCLSIERPDNRIDMWIDRGVVAFLDPHRMIRRVLPGGNKMVYREIRPEMLAEAETLHSQQGLPMFLALRDLGFFKPEEVKDMMRLLGEEVVHDFIRDQGSCAFSYRRCTELPDYAKEFNLRLGITPILLEASKVLDDWRVISKVFPDPDAPVQPVPDMFSKISSLDLAVLEIKLLTQINGENSPRQIAPIMGLPLKEVYSVLVNFAKAGVVIAPGGLESLPEESLDAESSMQVAFDALDANDDKAAIGSALGKVLGDGGKQDKRGASGKFGIDLLDVTRKRGV